MTLAEAVETLKRYCERVGYCEECIFGDDTGDVCKLISNEPRHYTIPTETNLYDEEERHVNCTVQILRNSVTGEESIGWWENEVL